MLKFRNIDIDPSHHVSEWGVEGLLTAIERGDAGHWDRIVAWAAREPTGQFRADLAEALSLADGGGRAWISAVLRRQEETPHERLLRRMRLALRTSGLSQADFAREIGTSASRFSTYLSGGTVPSAEIVERMEQLAEQYRLSRLPA